MRNRSMTLYVLLLVAALLAGAAVTVGAAAAQRQAGGVQSPLPPGEPAVLTVTEGQLTWTPVGGYAAFMLRVSGPEDFYWEQKFEGAPVLPVKDANGKALADGVYAYTLVGLPAGPQAASAPAADGRLAGGASAAQGATLSGYFSVQEGAFVLPALEADAGAVQQASAPAGPEAPNDQVIADDLIVQGSICVGFDCVNNESFGFDTIRLKENNTRIGFQDTSVGTFPTNDWQIVANDSASGGPSYLGFQDVDAGRMPFLVRAGAPANALYVADSGRVGLRTNTPTEELHIVVGDTPTIRLDQQGGGFDPQIWDVAGNEANFFVRDVTSGSLLPLRIRPGAPTSSLDINAQGDVGLGTANPQADLHLARSATGEAVTFRIQNTGEVKQWNMTLTPGGKLQIAEDSTSTRPEFSLDGNGNLFITGALAQGSDVNSKQGFAAIDRPALLDRLAGLPVTTWSYQADAPGVRHIGPTAQDFYAAFGLGADERYISPLDASGVALAAAQELNRADQAQRAQIAALQGEKAELAGRLAKLEARLAALEAGQSGPAVWALLAAAAWLAGCLALLAAAVLWRRRA